MNPYTIALFFHLIFVLLACAAAAVAMFASLKLRAASDVAEAFEWLSVVRRVVPTFPVAVLGLLATGGYMTHQLRAWSVPWVDAALVGLGLIVMLGSGIEAARGRLLGRELAASGLSPRAQRLLRDPVAWTAKMTTLTLVVAVVFVMTVKPHAKGSTVALAVAVLSGALAAIPLWRAPAPSRASAGPPLQAGGATMG